MRSSLTQHFMGAAMLTLIFEIQYKTIEVLQHTPILKTLVIHSTTAVFYNQVGNEFQIIKRDGGAQGVEIVEAR
jgi:hypothetical protein